MNEAKMPELPPISDEDRQWLSYNPNTSDIVDWVRAYGLECMRLERERCAKLCEQEHLEDPRSTADDIAYDLAVDDCAAAIRAQTKEPT